MATRFPYRTLPGVHPEGRVLHARLGPHAVRRLHRGLDRVPDRARSPEAQIRHGQDAGAESRVRQAQSSHDVGIVSLGSCDGAVREALDILRASRHPARLHARARLSVRPGGRGLPGARIRSCSWSSRTATRSCSSLLTLETAVEKAQAALHPALQRPADVVERASSTACSAELGARNSALSASAVNRFGDPMSFIAKPKIAHPEPAAQRARPDAP